MDYFSAVLNQVTIFLLIIVVGFIVVKTGAVPESVLPSISILFAKIIIPAIIFYNTVNGATREDLADTFFLVGIIIIIFSTLIILMRILPKLLKLEGNRAKLFPALFSFGNVGFIGIPLMLAIFGQRGMVFITLFAIIDQIVIWTYGYSMTFPVEHKFKYSPKMLLLLVKPPIIAILLSVILILLEVRLPVLLDRAVNSVQSAGLSLPFLYIGGMLATIKEVKLLKCKEIYISIFIKMLVFPIIVLLALNAAGIPSDMIIATTIMFGLPSMPIIPMLAGINGSDAKYATATVMVTTIASLFTLTFVTYMITVVL